MSEPRTMVVLNPNYGYDNPNHTVEHVGDSIIWKCKGRVIAQIAAGWAFEPPPWQNHVCLPDQSKPESHPFDEQHYRTGRH